MNAETKVIKNKYIVWFLCIVSVLSLVFTQFFVFSASAAGSTYYVSTGGSDNNPGTLSSPWRTIQKAANMVTQGDKVYVRGGTYREKITFSDVQGTSSAWITFQPYNNEAVVVDGYGLGNDYDGIFQFKDGCSYIRITGFEIKRTTSHGIFLNGGEINRIRIDHCTIHDCESSGIYCYSGSQPSKYVRNVEFDNNVVYDVNNGYAYDDTHTLSPQEAISFSNVQGFNIHHNTLSQYGKEGIDVKSGSNSGQIHHNTIHTSLSSPAFQWDYNHIGIYVDGFNKKNYGISVYCNTITGYGGCGIVIGAERPESGGSIEDISIYNNVIALSYLAGHTGFRGIDSFYNCPFRNVYIYCNTIYNGGSSNSPIRIFPSASNIVNTVISNNIISGTAYYLICFQELRSTEISGRLTLKNNLYYRYGDIGHNLWKNGADKSWGSNYILNDPKLISLNNINYHLQSSSPAIDAGSLSNSASTDFDGVARPQGNGIDIGAYEYISTTNNPVAFSSMSPADGSTNVPISTPSLSLTITDPEGKSFSYTIQTRPNIGSISVNSVYSGTKYCTVSGLAYGTTYRWWVNATDGSSWTRRTYTFTTASNPSNNPPVFSSMSPADGSTNVPLSTSALSLYISDPEGKSFSYTIQTRPNIGSISVNSVYSGTKYCTVSGLAYGTTYRWWVNATDGSSWTRRTYTFTTASNPSNNPPVFSSMSPANGSTNVPIKTEALSLYITDPEGKSFSYTIQTHPNVGKISVNTVYGSTKYCTVSGLAYGTTYRWWVNATDGSSWTRRWFTFTTQRDPASTPPGGGGGTPPSDGDVPSNETIPPYNPEGTPPNAPQKPTGPTQIQTGGNYYYISTAYDADVNDMIRLRFDWGDGTYSDWTGLLPSNVTASLSHTWTNASSYNISVIAQDQKGLNSSWSEPLSVIVSQATDDEPIVVEIHTSSDVISPNELIQFDASDCSIPGSAIVSYNWEFGDGNTSAGKTAAHTYNTPGLYTVTLEVMDLLGGIYNKKINVAVTALPQAPVEQQANPLSLLLTILLIGAIFTLVLLLFSFTGKKIPFRFIGQSLVYSMNWLYRFIQKIARGIKTVVRRCIAFIKPQVHKLGSAVRHIRRSTYKKSVRPPLRQPSADLQRTETLRNLMIFQASPVDLDSLSESENADLTYIHNWIDNIN